MHTTLSPAQRKSLKATAHALEVVVIVGSAGLTPQVLREIDRNLSVHELIKIRVEDERENREIVLQQIARELDAAPVQHIGKILVVYRPSPEAKKPVPAIKRRNPARPLKRTFQNRA